jgi:hypothetical protein
MEPWPNITDRWPERALAIRKRCAVDPEFRAVVSDYCDARSALDHWRRIDPASSERVADYERLVRELEGSLMPQ